MEEKSELREMNQMKLVPYGKVITVGKIREYFADLNGAEKQMEN